MNFSNSIKYSALSSFSPNSVYLAIAKNTSLIIYDNEELKVIQKFSFPNILSNFLWSPDSSLVLMAFYKSGLCEIRSISNPKWTCTINESQSGIINCLWTPDSRKIILFNDFNVRLSIWSLVDKSTVYINSPKFNDKCITFCEKGNFMALGERQSGKDFIGIYFTGDFSLVSHFQVGTFDMCDLIWTKDATNLIVIDTPLEIKFLVYSPTGNLIFSCEPYLYGLGIEIAKLSSNSHTLGIGFNDGIIRLYNCMSNSFKEIIELNHNINIITNENLVTVFKEEEISPNGNDKNKRGLNINNNFNKNYTKYVECSFPYKLNQNNKLKSLQGIGAISILEWSLDSKFIASKYDAFPNVVFIWETTTLKLHTVIVQLNNIKNMKWSPKENILLIVTENSKLYTFTLDNVYIIELVSDMNNPFNAINLQWASDGKSFIVSDKKQMLIGHPNILENNLNQEENLNDNINEQNEQEEENENEHYINNINNNENNFNNIDNNDNEEEFNNNINNEIYNENEEQE